MVAKHSAVRHDLKCKKRIVSDTGWRHDPLPPRYGPYENTRPALAQWEWRCINLATDAGDKYRLLIEVAPLRDKWKAMLIKPTDGGPSVAIVRLEDQPGMNGGGLHVHANCDGLDEVTGADSVNMVYTLPEHRRYRRRRSAWTKALFCVAACKFFGTDSISDQEELPL